MQLWPAKENAFAASFAAASSRSASGSTITGVALPSSRLTRFRGARSRSPQPTAPEPVKVITRDALVLDEHVADLRRGADERRSASPAAAPPPSPARPAGAPRAASATAGLSTTAQPAASGGRELVRDEVEREVERRDRARRSRPGARSVNASLPSPACGGVHRHHLAGELARLDRGHRVRRHRRAAPRRAPPSAACPASARDLLRGLLGAAAEERPRRGRGSPRARAPAAARASPPRPRRSRACVSAAPAFATRADDVAGVGRADLDPLAGLDPFAVDQELPPVCGHRHS